MHQSSLIRIIFFICIMCNANSMQHSGVSWSLEPKGVGDDSCDELLDSFAKISSNYTFCVIRYSRPIKLCEKCVKDYQTVISVHNDILTLENEEGEQCKAKLLNLDRLEVIDGVFNYVTGLWNRASCNSCFNVDARNVPTNKLNDKALEILRLSNLTQTCIDKHMNDTHPSYGDPLVCAECKDFYQDLNSHYDSLKNTGFCMDIVDLMNSTRTQWSSKLGCCLDRKQPEWLFIVLSLVMTTMPCVFYLAAFLFVSRTEHTVFRQRRLHETFSSSATINSAMGSHD